MKTIILIVLMSATFSIYAQEAVTIVPFSKNARVEVYHDGDVFGNDPYGFAISANAEKWKEKLNADMIANGGMFLPGGHLVSYCISGGRQVSGRYVSIYKAALVRETKESPLKIIRVNSRDDLKGHFFVLQLPAVMLDKQYVWASGNKRFACLVIVETPGKMYFYYSRLAKNMKQIVQDIRTEIPDAINTVYLEGGPETSLLTGNVACIGCYEDGFCESYDCEEFLDLPNVIAVFEKDGKR